MADHKTDDLTPAQKNFLSRRIAGGDELTKDRVQDYIDGHHKALAARLKVGTPRYFATITDHLDGPREQTEQPARREQPAPKSSGPRYDGAARSMPQKPSSGKDQFQTLRDKSSPRAYGKK